MPEANPAEFSLDDIKIHGAEVVDKPIQGPPFARPTEIIVDAKAWRLMNQHAGEDLRHEAGGIMLGEIFEHAETTVVRISCAVPAREALNTLTSVQFTYSAWSQMEKERRQSAPTEKLVGWYHTHPGFSAFFSPTDHFTHEHFFTQPWHVALVIDPVNVEHRFYRWQEGQVQEAREFLLQVDQWPGPQPPVAAALSSALRQAAKQAAAGADPALGAALHQLLASLRRRPLAGPLDDLLPFVVACSELGPEVLAEARRRVGQDTSPQSPIRMADLEMRSNNVNPGGAISIAGGWLAQQTGRRRLHLHSLEESQPFCGEVELPLAIRDLTIDEGGNLLVAAADGDCSLHRLEPSLAMIRSASRSSGRRQRMVPLAVDWQGREPAGKVGKILAGRRTLYLLTRSELHVLAMDPHHPSRCESIDVHTAAACGWDSFEPTAWTTDPLGNLFLLDGEARQVWRCDPLAGTWTSFLVDAALVQPQSLAAGLTALSIYDGGAAGSIVQYDLSGGRLLCRRPLDPEILRDGLCHLFGDGYQRLYVVTQRAVYETL
jgi:proteasome lid subunit RPN8/RPN11